MLQAEAQMRATMAEDTSAGLAAGMDPIAVEGYVPRSSPGIAAASPPRANGATQAANADTAASRSSAPRKTEHGSVQIFPSAGHVEQHDVPAPAAPQTAQGSNEQSAVAAGPSEAKATRSQSRLKELQHVSAASGSASGTSCRSGGAEASAQGRTELASNVIELGGPRAETGLRQSAEGMQRSAPASGTLQEEEEAEHGAAEGGGSHLADPAQQPVLVCSWASPVFRHVCTCST